MENENDKGNWQITVRYTHPLACDGGVCGPTASAFVDAPISVTVDGAKYYYLYDGLGSVTELIDEDENVVNQYRYTPFGEALVKIEGVFNPYQYTGRRYDQETGQYYYRARMYSPEQGRFLSQDPMGMVDGPNMYAYCGNNPVNRRDPSGRRHWPPPNAINSVSARGKRYVTCVCELLCSCYQFGSIWYVGVEGIRMDCVMYCVGYLAPPYSSGYGEMWKKHFPPDNCVPLPWYKYLNPRYNMCPYP